LPGGIIKGLEFAEWRPAGIIDQDIDFSECRCGGFDDVCCLRGILYVDWDGYYAAFAFAAQFFGCSLQCVGVAGAYDDIRAFGGQRGSAGFTESLTGGEDERRFAGELEVHGGKN
jgi:hypothetical protein